MFLFVNSIIKVTSVVLIVMIIIIIACAVSVMVILGARYLHIKMCVYDMHTYICLYMSAFNAWTAGRACPHTKASYVLRTVVQRTESTTCWHAMPHTASCGFSRVSGSFKLLWGCVRQGRSAQFGMRALEARQVTPAPLQRS